ncbi:MAG TPA: ABC transporter permease [Candidatus Corynebacterium avicola]|uniref:ABC transporter permease n=1 Tax=Candidatus Corynebacterium avicola TaxID=2838527 RepID=A0A9D1RQL2_9CORY|nr:ABC transporter permease [Candidatus Corynebacterium avicola]
MLVNTIKSEWIKLRSTKAVYWTTALIVFFSLGFSALIASANGSVYQSAVNDNDAELAAQNLSGLTVTSMVGGIQSFGLMIILIQAVLVVTGEYGNGTAKPNVLAAPKRWQLPVAKWIVYGVIAAVIAVVTTIASIFFGKWLAGMQIDDTSVLDDLSMSADGAWTVVLRMALYAIFAVALAIGVSYLVRRTAGAMALVLLWVLVLEGVPSMIPKISDWLPQYMPFANIDSAVTLSEVDGAPWGEIGSVVYFAAICVVLFIAGVVALRRRDA